MNFQASIKMINKQINHELKNLSNWVNAYKFDLNVSKTELVMFSLQGSILDPYYCCNISDLHCAIKY